MKYLIDSIINQYDVNKCKMRDKYGVFDNFEKPFSAFYNAEIEKIVDKYDFCRANKKVIVDLLTEEFERNLINISMRTLIYDFNEEYNDVYMKEGDTEYKLKDESFNDKENIKKLFSKYPILKEIIEINLNYKLKSVEEIFSRLNSDKEEIKKKLNVNIDSLTNISLGEGDMHNNGKSVAILSFSKGKKIIYKPRSLDIDNTFNNILSWVNSNNNKFKFYVSKNLDKVNYGWQEFIEYKECKSEDEVEYYYYSIGALLSIVYLLNTSDMHYENIISFGKYPVIIDLETLMTNRSRLELEREYERYLFNSVLTTLIIPTKIRNPNLDMDLSAMGGMKEQVSKSINSFSLKNMFKNNISLVKQGSKIRGKENMVVLNGKVVFPQTKVYKIEEGFRDVSELIIKNKEELIDILRSKNFKIRQVLRATYIYAMYISASLHPKYLSDNNKYNSVFEVLNFSEKSVFDEEIKRVEKEILKKRNIPYFYTKLKSKDLFYIDSNDEEQRIEGYYRRSVFNDFENKVNKFTVDKMDEQLRIIRLSFLEENTLDYKSGNSGEYPVDYEKLIEKVIGLIDKYTFGEKEKYIMDLSLAEKLYMLPLNISLYEGGGVILLLNYYAHYKLDYDLKRKAEILLNSAVNSYPIEGETEVSAYSGIGSRIYIYYNLYKLWGNTEYLNTYNVLLKRLYDGIKNNKYSYNIDYLNGISSMIVLLSKLYKMNGDLIIKEMVSELLDILKEEYRDDSVKRTGLAHGYSGIALAFIFGGNMLDNNKFVEFGKQIVMKEDSYYIDQLGNWKDIRSSKNNDLVYWCYGATGISISRYMMLKEINDDNILNDLIRGTKKVKDCTTIDLKNDSLCHGFFGNIDVLNVIEKFNPKEYKDLIKERLEKISLAGFKDGFGGNGDILGGMIGISGMALTILRILQNKYPSILSLDIYKGEDYE